MPLFLKTPGLAAGQFRPISLCLVEKNKRALNIGSDKRTWRGDGPIDVAFRGEMYDRARLMLPQQGADKLFIADVPSNEQIARVFIQRRKVGRVSGICQQIKIDNPASNSLNPAQDEV
jgi:hypothetical protein